MSNRKIRISQAELFDALAINQIKQLYQVQDSNILEDYIIRIVSDLDEYSRAQNISLSGRFAHLLVGLSQVNLHIFESKSRMMMSPEDEFESHMMLAHQLNGVRNRFKREIQRIYEPHDSASVPTNTATDGLAGWLFSVIDKELDSIDISETPHSNPSVVASVGLNYSVADLVDRLSISQLKETRFDSDKRLLYTQDLLNITRDIDAHIGECGCKVLSGKLIRAVIFIAVANGLVWTLKERMEIAGDTRLRLDLLRQAQDINSLRNLAKEQICKATNDQQHGLKRAVFLESSPNVWYATIAVGLAS